MNHSKKIKCAGALILSFIVLSILHFSLIEQNLMHTDLREVIRYIQNNGFVFRIGIIIDLLLFINMLLVASILYSILKEVNHDIALLGLFFMGIQVTMGIVLELSSFGSLLLVQPDSPMSANETDGQRLLNIILQLRTSGYSVAIIFFCLSFVCFYSLFYKSKLVPSIIAILGFASVVLLFVCVLTQIVLPGSLAEMLVKVTSSIAMLVQIATGGWMIFQKLQSNR